jgi:hypothetical protein
MTFSSPDYSRGQVTIVLSGKNKDCALLHSYGPMSLMFSQAGMVNPGIGIAGLSGERV